MNRSEFASLLGAPAGLVAELHGGAVLVSEADPRRFMAAFAGAVARGGEVFLCDPGWGEHERAQLNVQCSTFNVRGATQPAEGWLMIPTGGTSGMLKFARHDEGTLSAAVRGFATHFGLSQVNSAGVLPLHHVSGLMAWLRCALTGGEFRPLDWKAVEGGELPDLPAKPTGWTISLVPTQLERLIGTGGGSSSSWTAAQLELGPPGITVGAETDPPKSMAGAACQPKPWRRLETGPPKKAIEWLRQFRIIFVGGAPAWPALLERAAELNLPISLGYGMTETAAMVTALRPAEFLAGVRSNGTALPHATVRIGEGERIVLSGQSLFRGYYPDWRDGADFATQDRGRLDGQGHLHVLGRLDAVIITGGEKVEPGELEALLRETGQFPDIVVLGLPDPRWGQQVVAVYPGNAHPNFHEVIVATNRLADYKRPKRFVPLIGPWPANAHGKINRAELLERVVAQLKERR